MRRLLIAVLGSLLAAALIAPAAQAASRIRYFQDFSDPSKQVYLTVDYADKRGNKKFTPRHVAYYFVVQVSCTLGGNSSVDGWSGTGPRPKVTKGKFDHPLLPGQSPTPGHPGSSTGYVKGKLIKKTKRIDGSVNVQDYESPPTFMNCATAGAIPYAATRCRLPSDTNSSLPACVQTFP
ncbi:MAG: hypothetical protein WB462_12835 [Solirubrobacterales bacterium]